MCTLIKHIFLSTLVSLVAFATFVKANTVGFKYENVSALQLNEISVAQSTKSISIDLPQLRSGLGFSSSINLIKQDLSNRNLTFPGDTVVPLSTIDSGERTSANIGFSFNFSNHAFSISTAQDIKPSLFTSKKVILGYQRQMYNGATVIKLTASESNDNQPLSYYIDPETLQSKERSTSVKSQIFGLSIQQIWNEKLKTLVSTGFKTTRQYRPDEIQFKIGSALALNHDWTLKNEFGLATENRSQSLTSDRGYFESRWFDLEMNYEWELDSFLTAGISFLDEIESDPRRNLKTALGTDQLAVGLKTNFESLTYDFKAAFTLNSERQNSSSGSAGVSWVF